MEKQEKSMKQEEQFLKTMAHIILILGAIMMLLPFIWMISTSLKSSTEVLEFPPRWIPRKMLFSNYIKAWRAEPFGIYFFNSFFCAVITTFGQLFTSALAAFAFAYMEFPLKNFIFFIFLGTMMIPQQALLVPDYIILAKLGWLNTYLALIVPWCASVFAIFMLRQFFLTLPKDLYEAAKIDGCSSFGYLWRILVPLSIPSMVTCGIFTFIGSWNSFLWPLIVTNSTSMRTIQVGLSAFSQAEGTQWELLMAASTFAIVPLVVGYFIAQNQFVEGVASSGLKE